VTAATLAIASPSHPVHAGAPSRKPPLPALTGVRTLLALNIVFFHFTPPHMRYLYPVIDRGYVFVGFFFLLSGYILAYNYADRPRPLVKRDFWLARFARLYPIYLLSLAFSIMMLLSEWHARPRWEFWSGIVLTPLLLQGWSPALATFWNTVGWTLSAEVVLYVAFPWLVRLPWPRTPGRLVALLLGIWALGLVPHALYLALNPDHLAGPADRYSSGIWLRALKYTPLAYVCTFLAGMALARIQAGLSLTPRQRTMVAAASLMLIAAFFATLVPRVPYVLMHGGLLLPLFAALVIGLSGQNAIASVFSWRPLVVLGQTTFCLYLLHFNAINLIRLYRLPERLHVASLDPWISYAAVLLLAYAAMRLVERPAREAILRRSQRTPRAAPQIDAEGAQAGKAAA
jgi:peptidoglycan/LPS O-acetylase OafA/YrhL